MKDSEDITPLIKESSEKLSQIRQIMRTAIADCLANLDATHPQTLSHTINALQDAKFTPLEIADLIGTSRTSVNRWAQGEALPRASSYRQWIVEKLISYLREDTVDPVVKADKSPSKPMRHKKVAHPELRHD